MSRHEMIQNYWEKNIGKYSEFYDKNSEEDIAAPNWLAPLYRQIIFPMERKVTRQRFDMVKSFIMHEVKDGDTVVDVGCGGGIFTELLISSGAKVIALDFAQSAVEMTKNRIQKDKDKLLEVRQFDIMKESIPKADACICVGLVPYLSDMDVFFKNTLPHCNKIWFNFLNPNTPSNLVRQFIPLLDVRHYYYQNPATVKKIMRSHNFIAKKEEKLGTGLGYLGVRKGFE